MSATAIAGIAVGAVASVSCIGSVLLLAFRVGKLTGTTETRIGQGEQDRANIWKAIGSLTGKIDRHIETPHQRAR